MIAHDPAPRERGWRRAAAHGAGLTLLVAAWFLVNGYHFGLADHAIHLVYVLRAGDPALLAKDFLAQASAHHPSVLWQTQALLARVVSMPALYLGLHVLSVAILFVGAAALARALHPGQDGRWLALAVGGLILLSRPVPAAIPSMDNLVLNRTLSLGPLLVALALGVGQRFRLAFLLCGLVFLIHPTTAFHAACLLLVAAVGRRPWRALGLDLAACALGAAPLLAWMLLAPSAAGVPLVGPPDWIALVRLRSPHHHFASAWGPSQWTPFLAPLLVLLTLRRTVPEPVWRYLAGTGMLCAGGWVGVESLHIGPAVQLHLWESGRFLFYLAAAQLAGALGGLAPWRWPRSAGLGLLLLGTGLDLWPLVAVGAALLAVDREAPGEGAPAALPWLAAALVVLVVVASLARGGPGTVGVGWRPPARVAGLVQAARELPADSLLLLPPDDEVALTWVRYGARRSVFASWKDGGEIAFALSLAREWRTRLEAICGCPLFSADHGSTARARVAAGYERADAARWRELARRFGVTHAVVTGDHPSPPDLPRVWRDARYAVYAVAP
jgi:hypothetical protein